MKKLLVFTILIVPFLTVFGQRHSAAIKLGYFNPESTEDGFVIGYEGGRQVDRLLRIGWSVDWFHKSYTDKSYLRELNYLGVANARINEIRAKTDIHDFPVMFNVTAMFPMNRRGGFYLTGGIGAEVLLIYYRDYQDPNEDELKGAFDFAWRVGMGTFFKFGRRSEIFGEIAYHDSEPSWEYEVYDSRWDRERIFERSFDMSGVMIRGGVRFYF